MNALIFPCNVCQEVSSTRQLGGRQAFTSLKQTYTLTFGRVVQWTRRTNSVRENKIKVQEKHYTHLNLQKKGDAKLSHVSWALLHMSIVPLVICNECLCHILV